MNLDRVQLILSDLGQVEDEIFKNRQKNELAFKAREKNKKRRTEAISNYKPNWVPVGQFAPNVSTKNKNYFFCQLKAKFY